MTFPAVLSVIMGAATFSLTAFGVLAAEVIAEFSLQRWQIGALVTAASLSAALISPSLGRVVDRIGARRAGILTLAASAVALAAVAGAPSESLLLGSALVAGVAQAASNPATNKLISLHVAAGQQGLITGIKQSGVQLGTFLGGLLLPVFAGWWGWRGAVVAFITVPVATAILAPLVLPTDPAPTAGPGHDTSTRIDGFIVRLAAYGFLLGSGGTAIFTYLALYAREELGLSPAAAGLAVALMGLTGVVGRIIWGRIAETSVGSVRALSTIALLAALATLLLLAAEHLGAWIIWPAALVVGASASAWNAVGMLAVIQTLPSREAGKGSGIVLLGFFGGLAFGSTAFGWSVDQLGTYGPGWVMVIVVFLAAWAMIRTAQAPEARS